MTMLEADQTSHTTEIRQIASIADFRVDPYAGGLVIIAPTAGPLAGLDALLATSGVVGVEVVGARMANWQTANNEAIQVSRQASRAIRDGQTAVIYLDSHVGEASPIAPERRDFACARLGQILIGLADAPAFVAVHSERMASTLILDSLETPDADEAGTVHAGCPAWVLSNCRMFPGLPVAMCAAGATADSLAGMIDGFEARRTSSPVTHIALD